MARVSDVLNLPWMPVRPAGRRSFRRVPLPAAKALVESLEPRRLLAAAAAGPVAPVFADFHPPAASATGVIRLGSVAAVGQKAWRSEVAGPVPLRLPSPNDQGGQPLSDLGLASPTPEAVGAAVPFTTREAEAATLSPGARRVVLTGKPSSTQTTPEVEASGRGYVELDATGEYVEFANVAGTNTLVIRHSIPDAAGGGGIERSLSLYVDGVFRQTLLLSSRNNWLYDPAGGSPNGQSNLPSDGVARVFWNEQRYRISGASVPAGATLRLQKNASDTAAFYRIDLVDLELAAPPLPPPTVPYVSVTSHGANGADTLDDTAAIQSAINAARSSGKVVWIPPGTYRQNGKFTNLEGVTVQGAGMWHTEILGTTTGGGFGGTLGFLIADRTVVSDLYLASLAQVRRTEDGSRVFTGGGRQYRVENVWVQHARVGFWVTGRDATIRGNRVRFTYADGIHLTNGDSGASFNTIIEHNHVRGSGDDGITILSEIDHATCVDNVVRHNTVVATSWGSNFVLSGGRGNRVENNYFADSVWSSALAVKQPPDYPMHPLESGIIRGNTIVRGGGNLSGQRRGALWIWSGDQAIQGLLVEGNQITSAIFHGIHLYASTSPQTVQFLANTISSPGDDGVRIASGVVGSGVFTNNVVTQPASGTQFRNLSGSYTWTGTGNSWQPDAVPPTLLEAASRKIHGAAGVFDLPLSLAAGQPATIEPRLGGPDQLVVRFSEDVIAADGTLSANDFLIANAAFSAASLVGNELVLSLADVGRRTTISVAFPGLADRAGNRIAGAATVQVRALFGDTNRSGSVTVSDLQAVKNQLLRPLGISNYLFDLNLSGTVTVSDLQAVKDHLLNTVA